MKYQVRIALIACSKRKRSGKHKASELYLGAMFQKSLRLATLKGFDHIFILSAKYGLLGLHDIISTYNLKLDEISRIDRHKWASKIVSELKRRVPKFENAQYTYFAGKMYHQDLPPGQKPFAGKQIGQILNWLDMQLINK